MPCSSGKAYFDIGNHAEYIFLAVREADWVLKKELEKNGKIGKNKRGEN